jgi:hypothetical protein
MAVLLEVLEGVTKDCIVSSTKSVFLFGRYGVVKGLLWAGACQSTKCIQALYLGSKWVASHYR